MLPAGTAEKRLDRRFRKVPEQPVADFADVVYACRDIAVIQGLEDSGNGGNFGFDGGLGVDLVVSDAFFGPAHQAGILQHVHIGIEKIDQFFPVGSGFGRCTGLQKANLAARQTDGDLQAFLFGSNFLFRDFPFRYVDGAGLTHVCRTNGDAGGHA